MSEEKEVFLMITSNNSSTSTVSPKAAAAGSLRLFGNTRVMVISALFIAMSIVLGKVLAFNIGTSIRISFENLPLLMAGLFFGPFIGAAVGIGADIIGCIIVGYAINPVITLGAAMIGFASGMFSIILGNKKMLPRIAFSVLSAHVLGSMLIKSIGMYIYFHTPMPVLMLRIPLYIGIGILEFYIIYLLLRNKAFSDQLEKVKTK